MKSVYNMRSIHKKNNRALSIALCCLIVIAIRIFPIAAEDKLEETDWRIVAQKLKLEPEDIQRLEKNRILITYYTYKQVFSPYVDSGMPLFITSDSLLNAYHVLYEESILRLERTNARRFSEVLRVLVTTLPTVSEKVKENPELVTSARKRAMIVVGTALHLMDDTAVIPADNTVKTIIEEEVKKILVATAIEKPTWLGSSDDPTLLALDYSRYKPRGFYTQSDLLQRYFRAVSWLQSIPFWVKKDEELLAILMLGECLNSLDYDEQREYEAMFYAYTMFIGAGDDWDIVVAAEEADDFRFDRIEDEIAHKQEWLLKKAIDDGESSQINDQIRFLFDNSGLAAEPNFRVMSAYRTPEALLFQRTLERSQFGHRKFPTGLEICIALGSSFARDTLRDKEKEKLLKVIDDAKSLFSGKSLYFAYLNCLAALLDAPEPDAPSFMRNMAWQAKSCNTALGGWAQLRHTWVLQAKQNVVYENGAHAPAGFVEPEPEFFSRMATLAEQTQRLLDLAGAFDPDYTPIVESLTKFMHLLEESKSEQNWRELFEKLPKRERTQFGYLYSFIMNFLPGNAEIGSEAYFQEKAQQLKQIIDDLNIGKLPEDSSVRRAIEYSEPDIKTLWQHFEKISRRLGTIAHKQLRGRELNTDEEKFLKHYGENIAQIMFYDGNSYLTPNDDAPKIVDVYSYYNEEYKGYLQVGIGRARALCVLYPWHGRDILCLGAILPYYEFFYDTRLTDVKWKQLLDSEERCPSVPSWLTPIIWEKGITKPFRNKREQ